MRAPTPSARPSTAPSTSMPAESSRGRPHTRASSDPHSNGPAVSRGASRSTMNHYHPTQMQDGQYRVPYLPSLTPDPMQWPSYPPPSSPPPLNHALSPYATVPLPSQLNNPGPEIRLHPSLAYVRGREPPITFDMSNNVYNCKFPNWRDHWLSQPATSPKVPSLSVWSPVLGRHIVVHREVEPKCVTVLDVLCTIQRAMRTRIGNEGIVEDINWENSGPTPGTKVTLFGGHHWFLGLSRSHESEDSFVLHTGRLPFS